MKLILEKKILILHVNLNSEWWKASKQDNIKYNLRPSDYFKTEIIQGGEVKSKIYGSYMSFIDIDEKRWWDIRENTEINV